MTNWLSYELESTAAYRDRTSEKFPHDSRNFLAAKKCRELANMPCSDKSLEKQIEAASLNEAYAIDTDGIGKSKFEQVMSDVLAGIGFHFNPNTPDEVILRIIGDLS